jgi:hypothetical protein
VSVRSGQPWRAGATVPSEEGECSCECTTNRVVGSDDSNTTQRSHWLNEHKIESPPHAHARTRTHTSLHAKSTTSESDENNTRTSEAASQPSQYALRAGSSMFVVISKIALAVATSTHVGRNRAERTGYVSGLRWRGEKRACEGERRRRGKDKPPPDILSQSRANVAVAATTTVRLCSVFWH